MSGLAGASTLLGHHRHLQAAVSSFPEHPDVAVLGAGVSGLVAAHVLSRRGADVVVIGVDHALTGHAGRAGPVLDRMAPALESHGALLGVLDDLGIGYGVSSGDQAVFSAGRDRGVIGAGALTGDGVIDRELAVALQRLNLMAAELDPDAPRSDSNAEWRDRMSLAAWATEQLGTPGANRALAILTRVIWAAEPDEISLMHALATIAGAGGVGPLVNGAWSDAWSGPALVRADRHPEGDRSCRSNRGRAHPFVSAHGGEPIRRVSIDGGAEGLLSALRRNGGGWFRDDLAVMRVAEDDRGVRLEGSLSSVTARHVIIDLPLASLARVDLRSTGALPRASWRPEGRVSSVVCTYQPSLVGKAFEAGRAVGDGLLSMGEARVVDGVPLVAAHACGAAADRWRRLSPAERRRQSLEQLNAWFGPGVAQPTGYVEQDSDTWSLGGWSPAARPGSGIEAAQSRFEPEERVHVVGPAHSPGWAGWLEGAVRSGQRAAELVA